MCRWDITGKNNNEKRNDNYGCNDVLFCHFCNCTKQQFILFSSNYDTNTKTFL